MTQGIIRIPYSIGDVVWRVSRTPREISIQCPECAGTLALRVRLGNGDDLSLPCACCSAGYSPSGVVKRWSHDVEPEVFTCRAVRVEGTAVSYRNRAGSWEDVGNLFGTREECQEACAGLAAASAEAESKRQMVHLEHKRRDLAWSAHYWYRKRRDLRDDLERVEKRLNAIKKGEKP